MHQQQPRNNNHTKEEKRYRDFGEQRKDSEREELTEEVFTLVTSGPVPFSTSFMFYTLLLLYVS